MEVAWVSLGSLAPGLDPLRSLGKDNFLLTWNKQRESQEATGSVTTHLDIDRKC